MRTEVIDCRAGRVTDGVSVHDIAAAILEQMKRNAMQDSVRNNQTRPATVQPFLYRLEERRMEQPQMRRDNLAEIAAVGLDVGASQPESRQLEVQQRDDSSDVLSSGEILRNLHAV